MGNLVLNSLKIENFRGFRCLQIEKLCRVNLITGKNNVGKTALLEAITFYLSDGSARSIFEILNRRGEIPLEFQQLRVSDLMNEKSNNGFVRGINSLFYGRETADKSDDGINKRSIKISTRAKTSTLTFELTVDAGFKSIEVVPSNKGSSSVRSQTTVGLLNYFQNLFTQPRVPLQIVSAAAQDSSRLGNLWDKIALTDEEETIIGILKIIESGTQRIGFTGEGEARAPFVKLDGLSKPVPMKSLGEGFNRLLEISLALVNAKDGVLLIDEIENGLHYSVQRNIWLEIIKVANRLNVQVFATTHSEDGVRTFQKAATANAKADAMLIRLVRQGVDIVAAEFNEEELKIVAEHEIEVR